MTPAVQLAKLKQDEEAQEARAYASSITVEELGKQIREGGMLPSQSPAFRATLEHIYGENTRDAFERDTISKLTRGELKFNSPQEMDEYLTKYRSEALTGASEYTIAGFNKGYQTFREQVAKVNDKVADEEAVRRGMMEASDNLGNVVLQVTDPMFKGNMSEAAQTIVDRYQLLRNTALLRDDAAREALSGVLGNIATLGNKELLTTLLDHKLDSGVTVRAAVGDLKAIQFTQAAEREYDQAQRERIDQEIRPFVEQADRGELKRSVFDMWVEKNEKYLTTPTIMAVIRGNEQAIEQQQNLIAQGAALARAEASQAEAMQNIRTAIDQGNLAFLPQQKVITPQGEVKDFNAKDAAIPYIQERIARENMPFGKQVEFWSTNNVENPEWEKQIKAGIFNLASVGWAYDGKAIGQLNEQGRTAIDTFIRINNTNPGYAQKLVGSEKDYRTLSDIQFLIEKGGFPDVNDAAALINQVNRSAIKASDFGSMKAKVASAVDDVLYPGTFGGTVSWFRGLFGNDQTNLTSVSADIRRRAELLVMSGQVPDAAAAVKATVEYMANPAVTTSINNTLYFNKDLPVVPKGEDVGQWMTRFIKEVPATIAKDQQMDSSAVRLEPNQYGGFTAWTGGVPLTDQTGKVITYTKDDISQWVEKTISSDRYKAITEANFENYRSRITKELKGMRRTDPYALERNFDATVNGMWWDRQLYSREGYEQILRDGNQGKPLSELFTIYKAKRFKE
ncbi:hypothetical protein [Cupriavidus gilardii]|uniref:hypothetical protein n=1 Tax=Cupriavidus gilardii TaxID=82541 RepID=UPI0021B45CF3|nr:hypothetical protein [Cupriavidus gilardii]UXC36652.1 hypothetical protein N4G38_04085 [Cupriavidus gilardii]